MMLYLKGLILLFGLRREICLFFPKNASRHHVPAVCLVWRGEFLRRLLNLKHKQAQWVFVSERVVCYLCKTEEESEVPI